MIGLNNVTVWKRTGWKKWRLHPNTWIGNMKLLIVTIEPAGPSDKFLISFSKEIKKELCRHVFKDDTLQN